jgi:hypothetical protein
MPCRGSGAASRDCCPSERGGAALIGTIGLLGNAARWATYGATGSVDGAVCGARGAIKYGSVLVTREDCE